MLPCGVSHDADIVVTWTWSFRPVNQEQVQRITPDGQKRILGSDGTLRITGINNGDIGNYTCDVVSLGGNDSRTVTLKVVGKYRKVPKLSHTRKLCCNQLKIQTKWPNCRVLCQKDVNGIANREDADQTAPLTAV